MNEAVKQREERRRGLGVSDGIAVGRVLRVHSGARSVYRAALDEADIEREVVRLHAAVDSARSRLLAVKERAEIELGHQHAYIFDAHQLMLEDRKLLNEVESCIRQESVNAEWAVKVVTDRLLAVYAEIKDDYLRDRGSDIEDVALRIIVALRGKGVSNRRLTEDAVIVAEQLLPSTLAELDFERIHAVVSDAGGWTSHAAIIARGLGIPAVVGLRDLFRRVRTGDPIAVNATTGEVVLHPLPSTIEQFNSIRAREVTVAAVGTAAATAHNATDAGLIEREAPEAPARTLDGEEVILRANIELPAEYNGVRRYGARGIGLYRSEFLWSQHGRMPTEAEQLAAYIKIAELAAPSSATIRMFDLGGDKAMPMDGDAERNPALGLRAIRYSLQREEVLRTQARAVLRASSHGRLRIVLPMVTDVADVRRAKRIIEEERGRLANEGEEIAAVEIGAMIEVPSAVLTAEKIAAEVDFFSLGTNDLVQYLLAVDRGNDEVAEWFRSLHPAVLLSIHKTLSVARAGSIPAVVCGEMAATPTYAFVLIGLGASELSMTASSIPRVQRMIAGISAQDARAIAEECLQCETADSVEELVRERLGKGMAARFPA